MDSTTMITDIARKRFWAEPQISATLMRDHATPPFWTECLTALGNKMHLRQLAEISWKGELTEIQAPIKYLTTFKIFRQNKTPLKLICHMNMWYECWLYMMTPKVINNWKIVSWQSVIPGSQRRFSPKYSHYKLYSSAYIYMRLHFFFC